MRVDDQNYECCLHWQSSYSDIECLDFVFTIYYTYFNFVLSVFN